MTAKTQPHDIQAKFLSIAAMMMGFWLTKHAAERTAQRASKQSVLYCPMNGQMAAALISVSHSPSAHFCIATISVVGMVAATLLASFLWIDRTPLAFVAVALFAAFNSVADSGLSLSPTALILAIVGTTFFCGHEIKVT